MIKAASLFRSIMKWFENCTLGASDLSGQDGIGSTFVRFFLFWGSCGRVNRVVMSYFFQGMELLT